LYPVRASAATVISSKNTNMLNRSPVRLKPIIAAMNTSMST
jgi:hypothetical protein